MKTLQVSDGYDFIIYLQDGRIHTFHMVELPEDIEAALIIAEAELLAAEAAELARAGKVDVEAALEPLRNAQLTKAQQDALTVFEVAIKDATWRR